MARCSRSRRSDKPQGGAGDSWRAGRTTSTRPNLNRADVIVNELRHTRCRVIGKLNLPCPHLFKIYLKTGILINHQIWWQYSVKFSSQQSSKVPASRNAS